jgi:hypothetical protein
MDLTGVSAVLSNQAPICEKVEGVLFGSILPSDAIS